MVSYVTGGGGDTLGTVAGCSAFDAYAIGLNSHATRRSRPPTARCTTTSSSRSPPTRSRSRHGRERKHLRRPDVLDQHGSRHNDRQQPAPLTNATSAAIAFHSTAYRPDVHLRARRWLAVAVHEPREPQFPGSRQSHLHDRHDRGERPEPIARVVHLDRRHQPAVTAGGLTATATSPSTVGLTWNASTDDTGVAGYDIFRDCGADRLGRPDHHDFVDSTVSARPRTSTRSTPRRRGQRVVVERAGGVTTPSSGGPSQPWLVQAAGASETVAGTSLSATLPAPTTSGHLLVLSASLYTGITNPITSVTDTAGNPWTRIGVFAVSGHYSDGEMWYAANAAAVTSVTVHTASAMVIAVEVEEFAGIATTNPLDVSTGTSNTGTSAGSGPTTPTGTGDLVVGFIAGHGKDQAHQRHVSRLHRPTATDEQQRLEHRECHHRLPGPDRGRHPDLRGQLLLIDVLGRRHRLLQSPRRRNVGVA